MKLLLSLSVLFVSAVTLAQPTTRIIASGAEAEKIYGSIQSFERHMIPGDVSSTVFKVVNFTSSNFMIQKGEKGLVCEKYASQSAIAASGTSCLCFLVDLTSLK